jgi:hypothetical protein
MGLLRATAAMACLGKGGHGMAIRFFETLLLASFLSAVAYGMGRLFGTLIQQMIEQGANADVVRALVARRGIIERGLDGRVRTRRADMAKLDREVKELVRKRINLDHAIGEARSIADHIIRLVGEELVGRERFVGLVFNKYVGSGGGNALVDPAWAVAQEVEVWAIGLVEARVELEKRFPPSFGFSISSLVSASKEAAAAATAS